MISIQRNEENKDLIVMITTGKNTSYINSSTATNKAHLEQLIGSAAQAMGRSWMNAVEEYDALYRKLVTLSKERKRRLQNVVIPDEIVNDYCIFAGVRNHLLSDGILTLEEIFWFDWFCRKHKLVVQ